jgi:hypothetical protein
VPGQAAEDPLKARLAMLEDIDAIRALNRAFARQVSAGATGAMGIDPGIRGWPFTISVSAIRFGFLPIDRRRFA